MSTFISTTFGSISGRHGSAVAKVRRNGINVLAVFNAPFNPKSVKQVAQRSKFTFGMLMLTCLHDLFKKTFMGMNAGNHGLSLAMRNSVIGTSPDYSIDYPNLKFSEGRVYIANLVTAEKTIGTSIKMDWSTTIMESALPTDGVSLIFFHEEYQQAIFKENCALRPVGTITVELPDEWTGGSIHTWIYFTKKDGSSKSNSQYISLVQL